jgi:hypothetical protein
MIYLKTETEKDYMNEKVKMVGTSEFPWIIGNYLSGGQSGMTAIMKNGSIYAAMQKLSKETNSDILKNAISKEVQEIIVHNALLKSDYIWAPIDEPASGMGWCWPSIVWENVYNNIKEKSPHSLVYINLAGSGRGNTYLFEKNYLKTHHSMPNINPPYNALDISVKSDTNSNLLGFNYSNNGKPMFLRDNKLLKLRNLDFEILKKTWFENIKATAIGYQFTGDIFGINSYSDFLKYPILAGITVDAIKAGIGKKTPVWLYFDSNGYAKPANVTPENYALNIKCQIYTSIIHGATGALFYSDLSKPSQNFNALIPVVKVLNDNLTYIYLKTIEKKTEGDLQYVVKIDSRNHKYLIAVNTNPKETILITHYLSVKKFLNPLEVYISTK